MFNSPVMFSPAVFNKAIRTNVRPPVDADLTELQRVGEEEEAKQLQNPQVQSMFANAMMTESQNRAGRGLPGQNPRDQQGYGDLQNPSYFDKETRLPFDVSYDSTKNYNGIVNAYGQQRFAAGEEVVNSLKRLAPLAQRAMGYHGSLYDGVVDNFAVNRLYISNQRNREDNVYAFI